MKILVLNSGSSSQKASFFEVSGPAPDVPPKPSWEGTIEWADNSATIEARTAAGKLTRRTIESGEHCDATAHLLDALVSGETRVLSEFSEIDVFGHRIVNGGRSHSHPAMITSQVKTAIEEMAVFAPLHNRVELEGIAAIEKLCGAVPQVAVFDTGFHSGLPEAAAIYPGPYDWVKRGIRKFGFHGINHQYCADRAAQLLGRSLSTLKLVTCHLGNGCSLAAVRGGRSIDTTMGFTPLDGLMMGTRSGSVDPGVLTFLLRVHATDGKGLDHMLNAESGLLGISGVSHDMRQILSAIRAGNERARLAFDMFVHRLRAGIGSMMAALGGVDAVVFSGGIGENSPEVRADACASFAFLGLLVDPMKNSCLDSDRDIATLDSKIRVIVVRAQEDWAIAKECIRLAASGAIKSSQLRDVVAQ